jgi:zinc protease
LTRDDVAAFHRRHYTPDDAFLVAVGDTDPRALQACADAAFGPWTGDRATRPAPTLQPADILPGIQLVDRPGAPQSEVRIGTVGAERTTHDYFALLVLNTMLGGSFSSRLNTRLREERGLTYGAFSRFAFRRSRGPFVAGASVDREATHLAIAETLDVIHTIGAEVAGEEETGRARRYLALGLVHGLETNAGVAARLVEVEVHRLGVGYYEGYVERILAVTPEAAREVAARYLGSGGKAIAVVGDGARIRGELEGLGLGPVVEVGSEG